MLKKFPWLPVGFDVDDGQKILRVIDTGQEQYQLCSMANNKICLLIKKNACTANITEALEFATDKKTAEISFACETFIYTVFAYDDAPVRIVSIPKRSDFYTGNELCNLAQAMTVYPESSWGESIYFPKTKKIVPFGSKETEEERRQLATLLLTSGVSDTHLSVRQIHNINQWITINEIRSFFEFLDMQINEIDKSHKTHTKPVSSQDFILPGQPSLQQIYRGIIDYYSNQSDYKKMGVAPPGGLLLHGEPGVGKSYSVQKFAEFTGWHFVEVTIGDVSSPYIHDTSRLIRSKFDDAKKHTPSIIFLDELDAMGASRDNINQGHKTEEITELLKQIEQANKNDTLVIAATNRVEDIDAALQRKGRFDNMVRVNFPSVENIEQVLQHELSQRPHSAGLNLSEIAGRLLNHPLSDVAYVINEAARFAVKEGKSEICQECLDTALQIIAEKTDPNRFFL